MAQIALATFREFLAQEANIQVEIQADTALFSGGLLDSFAVLALIQFIELQSGLQMATDDLSLEHLDSLDKINAFLASQAA